MGFINRLKINQLGWTVGVFLFAFAVRLINLDHTPQWDEMYHFLAGKSWLQNGTLAIADGEYTRAPLFTILVGASMRVFGETLEGARIPSVLSGALLVALCFNFTAAQAGRNAGLLAALLLCFHPLSIYVSQIARFYAIHALCFWVGAYGAFQMVERPGLNLRSGLWLLLMTLSLWLAYEMQITTIVGIGGLCLYTALRWGHTLVLSHGRRKYWILASVAGVALIAGLFLWTTGCLEVLWKILRTPPTWGKGAAYNWRYYFNWMTTEIPLLWAGFPLAVMIAVRRNPRFGTFATTVFVVTIVVQTLGSAKSTRYVACGLPFLFVVWGIALDALIPAVRKVLSEISVQVARRELPSPLRRFFIAGGLTSIIAFSIVMNQGAPRSIDMLIQSDAHWNNPPFYRGFANWAAAAQTLQPLVNESAVILTSSGVKSYYFLGRSDFDISVTVKSETDTGQEFGVDPRTGWKVISQPESLEKIMAEHSNGLIVVEVSRWRKPANVPAEMADFIVANTDPVPLPKEWSLMAFRWQH